MTAAHSRCLPHLRDLIAESGIEVTISTAPPIVPSPWTEAFRCPHGTTYFFEPTGDQHATWAREGAR